MAEDGAAAHFIMMALIRLMDPAAPLNKKELVVTIMSSADRSKVKLGRHSVRTVIARRTYNGKQGRKRKGKRPCLKFDWFVLRGNRLFIRSPRNLLLWMRIRLSGPPVWGSRARRGWRVKNMGDAVMMRLGRPVRTFHWKGAKETLKPGDSPEKSGPALNSLGSLVAGLVLRTISRQLGELHLMPHPGGAVDQLYAASDGRAVILRVVAEFSEGWESAIWQTLRWGYEHREEYPETVLIVVIPSGSDADFLEWVSKGTERIHILHLAATLG